MIKTEEFIQRRSKLFNNIDNESVLILFSGYPIICGPDEYYDFVVDNNFYYLTNINQDNSVYIAYKNDDIITEYLFIETSDKLTEKWTGKKLSCDECRELSGINNVMNKNNLHSFINSLFNKEQHMYGYFNKVYLDYTNYDKKDFSLKDFVSSLSKNYNLNTYQDISSKIYELRSVKSVAEIEEFKKAIAKTDIGLKEILKKLKPGLHEYNLSNLFLYKIREIDNSNLSFPTIAASGKNATILHYPNPNGIIKDGDLILFDLGSKNNGYCADISRTYPINGKFSDLQRLIYSIVLDCNKLIIDTAKPGLTIKDLQNTAKKYLARRCLEANLIDKLEDIDKVYYHGVSHSIGLDTHDPYDYEKPLERGNIISDEPGLYFENLNIGVRIEDDLLITDDGCYCLSGNIIKEINDIEKAMLLRE